MQRQLNSVPINFYPSLLEKLFVCIASAQQHAPKAVPSLAAALAALAVQWEDWKDPLNDIGVHFVYLPHVSLRGLESLFSQNMGAELRIARSPPLLLFLILCARHPGQKLPPAATIEFMRALPLECTDSRYAAGQSATATQDILESMRKRVRDMLAFHQRNAFACCIACACTLFAVLSHAM